MIKLHITLRSISLLVICCLLSSCLGGTIAQQIVRSIATHIADKQIARAMDVDEDQLVSNRKLNYETKAAYSQKKVEPISRIIAPYQPANVADLTPKSPFNHLQKLNKAKQNLANDQSNSLELAKINLALKKDLSNDLKLTDLKLTDLKTTDLKNSEFEPANLNALDLKPIAEPLPQYLADESKTFAAIQTNQLVPVELFNLLIGEEKNAVYERARLIGALNLPQKREWQNWQVASGVTQLGKKSIIFLIPPEFGKLPTGSITMVELAETGELNVVRYKTN